MTNRSTPSPAVSTTVVVVGVVVVFCFTIAACVAIFVAAPDGANTGSLVTILLSSVAQVIGVLALLIKVSGTDAKVDQVAQDTYRLTNGLLDAKVRAGVADVVDPSLLREDAHVQVALDRQVRSQVHPTTTPNPHLDA